MPYNNTDSSEEPRLAVVGAGAFGRNHLRVLHESPNANLTAVVDLDERLVRECAVKFDCQAFRDWQDLGGKVDAAVVAVPTVAHEEVARGLMEAGIDVLVEKPIAPDLNSAQRLLDVAESEKRILQVGHLESFNPGVAALSDAVTLPLFFEIHRLSMFTQRSLDVDVILDLMIHDIDILLALTGLMPTEIQAAGISVLSKKVDIANVRLAFETGCVANLTASRVSTERIRKLRLFQPGQYISLDYQKQDAVAFQVTDDREIRFNPLPVEKDEPLRLELESFVDCVARRVKPRVDGTRAIRALKVALEILARIEEHRAVVERSVSTF